MLFRPFRADEHGDAPPRGVAPGWFVVGPLGRERGAGSASAEGSGALLEDSFVGDHAELGADGVPGGEEDRGEEHDDEARGFDHADVVPGDRPSEVLDDSCDDHIERPVGLVPERQDDRDDSESNRGKGDGVVSKLRRASECQPMPRPALGTHDGHLRMSQKHTEDSNGLLLTTRTLQRPAIQRPCSISIRRLGR